VLGNEKGKSPIDEAAIREEQVFNDFMKRRAGRLAASRAEAARVLAIGVQMRLIYSISN
jgi:hypothetical protein